MELIQKSYGTKRQEAVLSAADDARKVIEHIGSHAPPHQDFLPFIRWLLDHQYLDPYLGIDSTRGWENCKINPNVINDHETLKGKLHESHTTHRIALERFQATNGQHVTITPSHFNPLTRKLDAIHFEEDPLNRVNRMLQNRAWTPDAANVNCESGQVEIIDEHSFTQGSNYSSEKVKRMKIGITNYGEAFSDTLKLCFGVPKDSLLLVPDTQILDKANYTQVELDLLTQEAGKFLRFRFGLDSYRRERFPSARAVRRSYTHGYAIS